MEPRSARLVLGAMRAVARADGESPPETRLIEAAARLLGVDPEVEPVDVEELRAAGLEEQDAKRVVQAAVLVALMDERVDASEVSAVSAIADALGVDEPRVQNLAQIAKGQMRMLWLDLARRSWARDVFMGALKREGLGGVWKIVGPLVGGAKNPELAQRYLELGELAPDTMGYRYFRFIVDNDIGFPGEPHGVPESGVWHDCAHVLGGFGIEPAEEIQVVSFIAGFSRQDPFFWLFTITLQFHLGVGMSPYSAPERGLFDPEQILAAFSRGAAMSEDLSAEGWDPWRLFPMRLEDARAALGVAPR